ncbi:DUF484 family protein [Nitrosovibrio tenuis]|uniref:DUF484 domain-containing protein n=1 Tax=Nitrosovibrio tenuis TaxID=1233 RepID=A0A1H7LWE7_9PROT|nr:DUF484 family protein [Nitrosovibrio tenuis]SEL03048.1 hypothetical protein SAMN05216387_104179 [Nitrosovibrio tenuis]
MKFSSDEIAQYLRKHPQFFEEYADMLADIQVPHPHGGRAIPISERQIVALRDKNRILQEKLSELIRFGEENGALTEKIHRLAVALLTFTNLNDSLDGLHFNLREDFSIPHMALRLWNITSDDTVLSEFSQTSKDIRILAESLLHPYCGLHVLDEIKSWFGDDAVRLRSFAMVGLRARSTVFGLMVMGSEDPQRFYPEMGTIYLAQLGQLISAALGRFTLADASSNNAQPASDLHDIQ